MIEPKRRSALLPMMLIVVVVIAVAGVVVAFVPIVECDMCLGVGTMSGKDSSMLVHDMVNLRFDESNLPPAGNWNKIEWSCPWCSGNSKITPFRRWGMEMPEIIRREQAEKSHDFRRLRELRMSAP